jgi:hypothetical protein
MNLSRKVSESFGDELMPILLTLRIEWNLSGQEA